MLCADLGVQVMLAIMHACVSAEPHQAMIILLLANLLNVEYKNLGYKTVLVLTDLRVRWCSAGWKCIAHRDSVQDKAAAAGILADMLQHKHLVNAELRTLLEEGH